jgi:hypothetical protein
MAHEISGALFVLIGQKKASAWLSAKYSGLLPTLRSEGHARLIPADDSIGFSKQLGPAVSLSRPSSKSWLLFENSGNPRDDG